jgi:hypothetical protein
VVRLPRDWLGPREDLVPIGRPANAGTPSPFAADGLPPTAEAFWSEDAAALHDAVQAPAAVSTNSAGSWTAEAPRRRVRLHRPARWARSPRPRARWALPVVALLVVAVIGSTETPGAGRGNHAPSLTRNADAVELAGLGTDGATRTVTLSHAELAQARAKATAKAVVHRRGEHLRRRPPVTRRTVSRTHRSKSRSASSPAPPALPTYAAVTTAPSVASTGSASASGASGGSPSSAAGPTGIGSTGSSNCDPTCS